MLSRLAVAVELCDELGDVRRRDPVDRKVAEHREQPAEGGAVLDRRRIAHVDAAVLPPGRDRPYRRRRHRLREHRQVRDTQRGELPVDPPLPRDRLALCPERAGVPGPRFAPTQPVSAQVPGTAAIAAIRFRRP